MNNVVAMSGEASSVPVRQELAQSFAQTIQTFEERGDKITGGVWVVFDDSGAWRCGWDGNHSALPATALVGMAIRGLTALRTD